MKATHYMEKSRFYLIREKDIIAWAKYNGLEFIRCACKFDNADVEDKSFKTILIKSYTHQQLMRSRLRPVQSHHQAQGVFSLKYH